MNARDEEALRIWQLNRGQVPMSQDAIDRMNSLLAEFYGPTSNEYERQMSCVAEIFSERPIFYSDLEPRLLAAL